MMMKSTLRRIIIVFLIDLVMLNVADSASRSTMTSCPQPSGAAEIEEILSDEISSGTIISYHFSCLAVRAFDLYDSLAVIIVYTESDEPMVNRTVQVAMECEDSEWTVSEEPQVVSIVDGLPETQYQCYKCTYPRPDHGPGSHNEYNELTWCLECSENCQKMGGGFCVSPSTYSCCPYFSNEDGICVETCEDRKAVNSTNHCTDECVNYWAGIDCQNCSLECFNGGTPDVDCSECICLSGYTGQYCEHKVNPCDATSYCLHGGVPNEANCTNCTCPIGYTGDRCEQVVVIDPCQSNPCFNGGTCVQDGRNYSCVCPNGWTGNNCETEVDKCSGDDYCKNGGMCIPTDEAGVVVCNCSFTNFTGPTCEEEEDICDEYPDICLNGGTCVNEGECVCANGFTGLHCEDTTDPDCPCLNGGSCERIEGESICFCPDGFIGPLCEYPNPCLPSPCLNGGSCIVDRNIYGSFTCVCDEGWTGSLCDVCVDIGDISECSFQPTRELSSEGDDNNNAKLGIIIGVVIGVIMVVILVGSLVLLGVVIYRRFERIQDEEKSAEVDKGAFDGSKVMVNPVFITPDDLTIEDSMKTKI